MAERLLVELLVALHVDHEGFHALRRTHTSRAIQHWTDRALRFLLLFIGSNTEKQVHRYRVRLSDVHIANIPTLVQDEKAQLTESLSHRIFLRDVVTHRSIRGLVKQMLNLQLACVGSADNHADEKGKCGFYVI